MSTSGHPSFCVREMACEGGGVPRHMADDEVESRAGAADEQTLLKVSPGTSQGAVTHGRAAWKATAPEGVMRWRNSYWWGK
ncbi:hypothetical protein [Streptomyces sp. NPDC047042]|uniref:hypothetical protein n=1 Tax=Streptomyces sp. NPDC047042 TaxID=3154807 RepID=UPI0034056FEF